MMRSKPLSCEVQSASVLLDCHRNHLTASNWTEQARFAIFGNFEATRTWRGKLHKVDMVVCLLLVIYV